MLILEGSDCLGKTTFAKTLLKVADNVGRYPTFYSHMSRPNSKFDFFKDYRDMMSIYAIQDRFHIGGIVWHDAIDKHALSIIEGWLHSIGSMTILFYASDEAWYRKKIEEDDRGNMLSLDCMDRANGVYGMMAEGCYELHPKIDYFFDIKDNWYPTEEDAEKIIKEWFDRLEKL